MGLKYEHDEDSNKIEATMVRVFLSPRSGLRFYVRQRALLWDQVMQRLLRRRYVLTGDPTFDALFAVQASRGSRRYVKQFLSDHRRSTLIELQRQVPRVSLGAGRREGIAIGVRIEGRAWDKYVTKLVCELVQAAHELTS